MKEIERDDRMKEEEIEAIRTASMRLYTRFERRGSLTGPKNWYTLNRNVKIEYPSTVEVKVVSSRRVRFRMRWCSVNSNLSVRVKMILKIFDLNWGLFRVWKQAINYTMEMV